MIDTRKLIGFAAMIAVVVALVALQVAGNGGDSLGTVKLIVLGAMVVALAAASFAPGRYFAGPRRPLYALFPVLVFLVGALRLLLDGEQTLALAAAIGAAIFVILQVRQRPPADAAGEGEGTM